MINIIGMYFLKNLINLTYKYWIKINKFNNLKQIN